MTTSYSASTYDQTRPLSLVGSSPRTEGDAVLDVPRSGDECDRMLAVAARRMRLPGSQQSLVRELVRFLGAGSGVWTVGRRERLHQLIVLAGDDAVAPLLDLLGHTSRAEVTDEAEAVLRALASRPSMALFLLVWRFAADTLPATKASILRVVASATTKPPLRIFEAGLADPVVEVRDAAATALGRIATSDARKLLESRRSLERNPVVIAAIEDALDEIGSA